MDIVVHIITTAIGLLVVSRVLRGFEVDNMYAALLTALLLGVAHALMAPIAGITGRMVAEFLVTTQLAYPIKIAAIILFMLVINALVLKLVAAFAPGFRIASFTYALLAALLLVLLNALIGEAIGFAQAYLSHAPSRVTSHTRHLSVALHRARCEPSEHLLPIPRSPEMFKSYGMLLAIAIVLATAWFTPLGGDVRAANEEVEVEAGGTSTPLTVVVYPDGRTGFFDQATRTMFIYDQSLRRCNTIRQIDTLGDELERVRN